MKSYLSSFHKSVICQNLTEHVFSCAFGMLLPKSIESFQIIYLEFFFVRNRVLNNENNKRRLEATFMVLELETGAVVM